MSEGLADRHALLLTVAAADIDDLDHVSNLVYLRWVLDAARAHSDARGFDHAAYRRLGGIFNVRRHEIDYLAPGRLGDRVEVSTWVDPWKRAWCERRTEIVRVDDGRALARAVTTWAFVDLASGRPTRIPDELRAAFERRP
ncbi:MAG: acyl-CoA thioesterase [Myxococcales bacterium]|nr:acyl-CoA thioesterase [Myxococcales bacterium]MCB9713409.1 acyl-CoA thioesterase [Myxococcales bacterium]